MKSSYKICSLRSKDFIYLIERGIEYLIEKGSFFSSLITYYRDFFVIFIVYNVGVHQAKVYKLLYISVENVL